MDIRYPALAHYIDGEWTPGTGAATRDVISPADGTVLGKLPLASAEDVDRALSSAVRGFALWRTYSPAKRAEILVRAAQLIRERVDTLAQFTAMENGLPLFYAKQYTLRVPDLLEWDAAEGKRLYGRIVPSEPNFRLSVTREPIGPVAAFTPWNAPVLSPCRKIGNVLASGNSIVLKAAEETPAATIAAVQIFVDAGVPPGVISLLFGEPSQISQQLINSQIIRMVTFTGSIPIGRLIAQLAAARLKPVLLELGGHAPVVICADADIEHTVNTLIPAKYRNGGQACVAPSRFYIHDSIYEKFADAFVARAQAVPLGDPFEAKVEIGPLANPRRIAAIEELVDDAIKRGARLLCGGERLDRPGNYYPPTVLADLHADSRILAEEPFGPVALFIRYTDLDAVIASANSVPYGLAGYIFTQSATLAAKLSAKLECGTIGINFTGVTAANLPFGGVKDSGIGREGGIEGVSSYTVVKSVSHMFV